MGIGGCFYLAKKTNDKLSQITFATDDTKSGIGLGLTIVREIVLALGGTIQLNNRVQAGVVVGLDACIVLPLNDKPQTT